MDSMTLNGRVALVTGAGSGMGASHARLLAERGAHVLVQDIGDDERADATAQAIRDAGGLADAVNGDVSDTGWLQAAIGQVIADRGKIDILVNNAGISGLQTPFLDIDEAFFTRMFAVHVKGAFFASQAAIPSMQKQGYGKIINIASNFAMNGGCGMAHYTSAKGAPVGIDEGAGKRVRAGRHPRQRRCARSCAHADDGAVGRRRLRCFR